MISPILFSLPISDFPDIRPLAAFYADRFVYTANYQSLKKVEAWGSKWACKMSRSKIGSGIIYEQTQINLRFSLRLHISV